MSILATATALAAANALPSGQRAFSVCTLAMVTPAGVVVFDAAKLAAGDGTHLAAVQAMLGITGGTGSGPAWTYTAGTIGANLFKTDSPNVGPTTVITLAAQPLGLISGALAVGTRLALTRDDGGGTVDFRIDSIASSNGDAQLTGAIETNSTPITVWSGRFIASFIPAPTTGFTGTDASGTYVNGLKQS